MRCWRRSQAAIEEGREMQGGNVKRWDYGRYNELTIKHPVGSQLPLLGRRTSTSGRWR